MDHNLKVLVTGGRFHPGTAVVRALAGSGVQVDAADSYKLARSCRWHWSALARREHISAGRAFVEDITWDGSRMPEVPAETWRRAH